MGNKLSKEAMDEVLKEWSKDYVIYAPKLFLNGANYSDTDIIRYDTVEHIRDIEFDKKSNYSPKEILLPITETLFYFTEQSIKESDAPKKGFVIFLRSCDLHSVKVLDEIYLNNGLSDMYYNRIREKVKFILIGCPKSFENCFCTDMGCNQTDDYDCYVELKDDFIYINNKEPKWDLLFEKLSVEQLNVTPSYVTDTNTHVTIPDNLSLDVMESTIWNEYDSRCINCGRCNVVCPTCTCFSMQDIFYTDNGKVGERRRVWASCMVDGFTDMAGGHSFRNKNGQRMRFRVLHKIYDYKKRFGYNMCTGCGRCTDICPEYISLATCINKLPNAMKEVTKNE